MKNWGGRVEGQCGVFKDTGNERRAVEAEWGKQVVSRQKDNERQRRAYKVGR